MILEVKYDEFLPGNYTRYNSNKRTAKYISFQNTQPVEYMDKNKLMEVIK